MTITTTITKNDIRKAIDKLCPYKLFGTKENLDRVRDLLPYNVEPIELPESFFNEDMMDKLILVNTDQAKWQEWDDGWFCYHYCTNCGYKHFNPEEKVLPRRCPNCNRLMEGEDDDTI